MAGDTRFEDGVMTPWLARLTWDPEQDHWDLAKRKREIKWLEAHTVSLGFDVQSVS
jgi:hypothetical protein